jgi:hypothetical protein
MFTLDSESFIGAVAFNTKLRALQANEKLDCPFEDVR